MIKQFRAKRVLRLAVLWICFQLNSGLLFAEEPPADTTGKDQLQKRIDFGNSYIMGQSIKSGAVYLMHRKKSDIQSMLKSRENYRDEILEDLKIREARPHLDEDFNDN